MSAPVIHGSPSTGSVAGWHTVFDYAEGTSDDRRVRVCMGPASSLDAQRATLIGELSIITLEPATSPGSAVATIRVTYNDKTGISIPVGETRYPVYSVYPTMACIDLKAHPQLSDLGGIMPAIDVLIASGEIDSISTEYAGNDLALKYARLMIAGVTSYEAPAFNLSVTRFYKSEPSLASDYASINKVFTWGTIKTDGKSIPSSVDEPQYVDAAGAAKAASWRLISVAPVVQRNETNTVQWQFLGLERWAKWLYHGGTWEPAAL